VVRAGRTVSVGLQTSVALGRPLARDDGRPDHPPVVVSSQRLWEDRLGRDPHVIGRSLILGGTQYTIVGVLEPGAELPTFDLLSESASLSSTFAAVMPFRLNPATIGWMGQFNYAVIARLGPGVTLEQARAELNVLQRSVAQIAARETHEPAWRMGRGDVQAALRGGGLGTTDRGGLRVRATLLAMQVALSVTLLVITGLFVTSFVHLLGVDPGFSPDRVVAIEIAPVASR